MIFNSWQSLFYAKFKPNSQAILKSTLKIKSVKTLLQYVNVQFGYDKDKRQI